jgi:hypothetical protein
MDRMDGVQARWITTSSPSLCVCGMNGESPSPSPSLPVVGGEHSKCGLSQVVCSPFRPRVCTAYLCTSPADESALTNWWLCTRTGMRCYGERGKELRLAVSRLLFRCTRLSSPFSPYRPKHAPASLHSDFQLHRQKSSASD